MEEIILQSQCVRSKILALFLRGISGVITVFHMMKRKLVSGDSDTYP